MFDKRNRWVVQSIMVVAAIAFVGFLFLPLISAFQRESTPTAATASPTAQQADLEAQARGYELVLQREPDNQTALQGLLDVRIRQGNTQGVIAPLEKLAELNPNQPDYMILLAQAKERVGDREGAAQAYRSVLSTRPGEINALNGFVGLMLSQQRPEAAIGLLQDTIRMADEANKTQPGTIDVPSVQLLLGRVYAEQGRSNEAMAIYDEAIKNNPQDFRPVLAKAIVLQAEGKDEEAKPLFATAASLAPAQYKDQINQIATGGIGVSPSPNAGSSPNAAPSPNPAPSTDAAPSPSSSPTTEASPAN